MQYLHTGSVFQHLLTPLNSNFMALKGTEKEIYFRSAVKYFQIQLTKVVWSKEKLKLHIVILEHKFATFLYHGEVHETVKTGRWSSAQNYNTDCEWWCGTAATNLLRLEYFYCKIIWICRKQFSYDELTLEIISASRAV